jgi:hypothetical protein
VGHWLAGIVCSNPAGGVDVYFLSAVCLCEEPITCPEESYRLWCVIACVLEALARVGLLRQRKISHNN